MRRSRIGLTSALLFTLLATGVPRIASAQDMPPILAPLTPPPLVFVSPRPAPLAPSAEAVIPPAVGMPTPSPAAQPPRPTGHHPAPRHHPNTAPMEKKGLAAA